MFAGGLVVLPGVGLPHPLPASSHDFLVVAVADSSAAAVAEQLLAAAVVSCDSSYPVFAVG